MKVRIINGKIAEMNNPKSTGTVVDLPDKYLGTHLSKWLHVNGEFRINSKWKNPDLKPTPMRI